MGESRRDRSNGTLRVGGDRNSLFARLRFCSVNDELQDLTVRSCTSHHQCLGAQRMVGVAR